MHNLQIIASKVGLDIETSDILQGTILISATGIAVVIEPE